MAPPRNARSFGRPVRRFVVILLLVAVTQRLDAQSIRPAAILGGSGNVAAESLFEPSLGDIAAAAGPQPESDNRRACDGCPKRGVGQAFFDELLVNLFYGTANIVRGQDTGHITPVSWWNNLRRGLEWDLDQFEVNQFGHPYQGNNYFNAGRSNGLSFWESAALTAFGSGTWEYFGETNRPSINDLINTTMGGIALGEMFHRLGWLVRDPRDTGHTRHTRELIATAIDPVGSLRRLADGDSLRISDRPVDANPASLSIIGAGGVLWRGNNLKEINSTAGPFLELNLVYGDAIVRTERPYDHFEARLELGGGSPLSEIRVRGDLVSSRSPSRGTRFSVMQSYHYASNTAYRFGAQSVLGGISIDKTMGSRFGWSAAGSAGLTVLGAVDSLPPGEIIAPPNQGDPDAPKGVSTGPRNYDYGPGGNWGGHVVLRYLRRPLLTASYEAQHVYTLDGVLANHLLQRGRLTFDVPLRGRLGAGVGLEYFDRRTFYRSDDPDARFHFPQFRGMVTWAFR